VKPEPASPRESLSGVVERITYHNEENGFSVLRVQVQGKRDLVTVTGSAADPTPGEWLQAEGAWQRDPEHGMQFRAETLRTVAPTTREGIEKYLGSGMIKGIGPAYAKRLVEAFGEKVFEIIDQYSQKLESVPGIGPERRKRIKQAWNEQKTVREIMVFLHSHKVSTTRAVRIFKTYGDRSLDVLQKDPYVLARDIQGIGFQTADRLAQELGVEKDSVLRAAAGLEHILHEKTGEGHCGLPEEPLVEAATALLEIDPARVREGLARLLADKNAEKESTVGEPLIHLPGLLEAEKQVASRLVALAAQSPEYPAIDAEKALAWAADQTGCALAAAQREAVTAALQKRILVITGGPGTGKTTTLRTLLVILKAKKIRTVLCAPTGRAAKRLTEATGEKASTIHRLLRPPRDPDKDALRQTSGLAQARLVVVDETSMVDLPLMQRLLRNLPPQASLLLVGDADQLPSVGPGLVLHDLIACGRIPVVQLSEVFRQAATSRIIQAAHRINAGELPSIPARGEESEFYFVEAGTPERIQELVLDLVHSRIPRKWDYPSKEIQVLTPMNRSLLGTVELNRRLQEALNPPSPTKGETEKFGVRYREGDRVMQTLNNYDKEVFNGDMGIVRRVDTEERELTVAFEGENTTYDFNELDELTLAYATTIHKAQGSEFDVVVIPLAMQHFLLLQRNLLYTGLTRGKKLVVIVGEQRALSMAVQNNKSVLRHSNLLERLRTG
jgi:exodeoxyribonuclease V alpha subunit